MTTTQMPDSVTEKIDSFCELREATDPILNKTSSVYAQIVELNNQFLSSSQRKAGLSEKHKVLALVGIHATHGTDQSIDFAVTAALQVGATEDEIMDCLDLALLTGGGSAVARVQFAIAVLEYRMADTAKARLAGPGAPSFKQKFAFAERLTTPIP
jgi:alkylhydroperoxidase/carboxymuconolactone decarboxylase family protein YurZ